MGEIQIKKPQLGRAKTNRIRHPAAFCVSVHRLLGHIPKRQFLKKIPVSKYTVNPQYRASFLAP